MHNRCSWAAVLLCTVTGAALAQTGAYPGKPIRVLVPFSAGGTTDVVGRLVSQRLSAMYGQQVVVENRTGAGGHIAAEIVARAPADGYTLMVGSVGIHAAHGSYTKLPYDPARDLQPVILLVEVPLVMLVHPTLPLRSVKDFVALAKSRPGDLTYGSAGFGSSTHMTGALFEMMTDVKLSHVPYKGSAPALADLVGGQIQTMFEVISPALPHYITAGKLRALAVTTKNRLAVMPDLQTVAEGGVAGYESTAWYTFAAPSKVPAAVIQKLNADINSIIVAPDMQPRLAELGATRMGGAPEAAARYFAAETEKWSKVIRAAGIKAD